MCVCVSFLAKEENAGRRPFFFFLRHFPPLPPSGTGWKRDSRRSAREERGEDACAPTLTRGGGGGRTLQLSRGRAIQDRPKFFFFSLWLVCCSACVLACLCACLCACSPHHVCTVHQALPAGMPAAFPPCMQAQEEKKMETRGKKGDKHTRSAFPSNSISHDAADGLAHTPRQHSHSTPSPSPSPAPTTPTFSPSSIIVCHTRGHGISDGQAQRKRVLPTHLAQGLDGKRCCSQRR